jgi:hypothetical protein
MHEKRMAHVHAVAIHHHVDTIDIYTSS